MRERVDSLADPGSFREFSGRVGGAGSLSISVTTCGFLASVAVFVGVLVLRSSPLVRRLMHEDDAS